MKISYCNSVLLVNNMSQMQVCYRIVIMPMRECFLAVDK